MRDAVFPRIMVSPKCHCRKNLNFQVHQDMKLNAGLGQGFDHVKKRPGGGGNVRDWN